MEAVPLCIDPLNVLMSMWFGRNASCRQIYTWKHRINMMYVQSYGLTRMEPPSVKSKAMMEDEKICSSGLYVTN